MLVTVNDLEAAENTIVEGRVAPLDRVAVYVKAVSEHTGDTVNSEKVMIIDPDLMT